MLASIQSFYLHDFLSLIRNNSILCKDEDDGVSKDELTAVLLSSVESAEKILSNISEDKEHAESTNETDKLIEHVTT